MRCMQLNLEFTQSLFDIIKFFSHPELADSRLGFTECFKINTL